MVKLTDEQAAERAEARKQRKALKAREKRALAKDREAAMANMVPVSSLTGGQPFELDGQLLKVHSLESDFVVADALEPLPEGEGYREAWQRPVLPDTLVTPK